MVIYFVVEITNTSNYRRNDYLPQGIKWDSAKLCILNILLLYTRS